MWGKKWINGLLGNFFFMNKNMNYQHNNVCLQCIKLIFFTFLFFSFFRYLLTADSKVERIEWCNKINEALENVRKWDPNALRPVESINI